MPNNHPLKKSIYNNLGLSAPKAPKKATTLTVHGDKRYDSYYWLNQRDDASVINYLKEENAYLEQVMAESKSFQELLYNEMVDRIPADDESAPIYKNGYYYKHQFQKGMEYPIHLRSKNMHDEYEIILDENKRAEGHAFYDLENIQSSPNNRYLMFGEDTLSRRIYVLRFKDLHTDKIISDELPNTSADAYWANDDQTIFYTVKDDTLRPYRVYRHTLNTPISEDELIYEEDDPTFYISLNKSKSNRFIFIESNSTLTSEVHLIDADSPLAPIKIFQERARGVEYSIDHDGVHFYILTNYQSLNFQLMRCSEERTQLPEWSTVVDGREEILLEDMDVFRDYLVLTERENGLLKIRILHHNGGSQEIPFADEVYTAYTANNYELDTDIVRIIFSSPITPTTHFDYNVRTGQKSIIKQAIVKGDFNSNNYLTEAITIEARDGAKIPLSLAYHKDAYNQNEKPPVLLYGYGAYGYSINPAFSYSRLSLLDRGFVFAIAHIRGGEEKGRQWYEDGKLLNKKNTFFDFIDCAEGLVVRGYTAMGRLYAMGGSAGGLLMGAITNMRPDLWAGVISAVPFVDVVTTMLDDSIPLTTGEYDEWGNPQDAHYYYYIKSYSPYDNIVSQAYPPMLVTTGYYDSQVQYWEPAKYVAKMRELKTNNEPLLFYTNLDAGHGGASGRYAPLKEIALEYAFALILAEQTERFA